MIVYQHKKLDLYEALARIEERGKKHKKVNVLSSLFKRSENGSG